ncbi:HEAT repeat domain-containing protein [Nostoc spongiaeforme FACHB-130]|uniref:HEAT repeat domain-containing protein n=1 Tax=Nostoc spongiaeforme FACHB-130 TaxID=1357510 RepID=A0ABR8FT43_9NOSO|nr:HEAT repeat domain-containing protein [Nostoc spongiaeforme]MBD2594095.1 HEAT repeat domain-containing protein [Nostoc spongiaeforme FACHB-130]
MYDWQYFFNGDRTYLNQGSYRIFEPEWKAEILHWFSREDVDKQQKEDFIQALIDFDDGCGGFYRYRAYFLAAEAIAKFPECSLADRIVAQLLKWSYGYFRQDKRDWQILPQPLVERARKTLELTDRKRVVAAFVHLVHTTESRTIMRLAAEKLGKLDPGNKSAIAALALMPIAEDEYGFCGRSYSLAEIGVGDETAITTFIHEIQTNPDAESCSQSISGLGKIAHGNETAIAALIHLIETTQNKRNCQEAIASLRRIASGNQNAIVALGKFLQTNQGDTICYVAACALWTIDTGNQTAIQALVNIIATSARGYLVDSAAAYLLEISPKNQEAIASLLEIIENTKNESLLYTAAFYLWQFEPVNPQVISTLSQLIQSTQDESVRYYAAYSLLKFDPGNAQAIAALYEILESGQTEWRRLQVAKTLLKTDEYSHKAIQTVCELVKSPDKWIFSDAIAAFLQVLDPNHPLTIDTYIHLLNTTKNTSILMDVIWSLQRLNLDNKLFQEKLTELISSLVQLIQTFVDSDEQNSCSIQSTTTLSYESYLLDIADSLNKILPVEYLPQVLTSLKDYLNQQFYKNSSYRYEAVFKIILHCAENLNYPEFYQLWHS